METNTILKTDAYKLTHWPQYPPGSQYVRSYFESRGGSFEETMFFGLQGLVKEHLEGVRVTKEMIDEAEEFARGVFGQEYFNREGWEYILNDHGGLLPVQIMAVPEGTVVPAHNMLVEVVNTDPKVPWLTNALETMLVQLWYPISVATLSYEIKKLLSKAALDSSTSEAVPFGLNDFGFRGASSVNTAEIGGAAHLVNFLGTDTLVGIRYAQKYYGMGNTPIGHSVMATEHSTTTSWGKENEYVAYDHFLKEAPDSAILSVVSDSYDLFKAIEYFASIKDRILAREGRLVVRPDSGDPIEMLVRTLTALWENFGNGNYNTKGFKELPFQIGVIYGDGINYDTIVKMVDKATYEHGFSTDNYVFGMGGALLQQLNRDTHKFAFKCNEICINGEWRDVFKDPVTDKGKISKKGRQRLVKMQKGNFETIPYGDGEGNILEPVFKNGELLSTISFDKVRSVADSYL